MNSLDFPEIFFGFKKQSTSTSLFSKTIQSANVTEPVVDTPDTPMAVEEQSSSCEEQRRLAHESLDRMNQHLHNYLDMYPDSLTKPIRTITDRVTKTRAPNLLSRMLATCGSEFYMEGPGGGPRGRIQPNPGSAARRVTKRTGTTTSDSGAYPKKAFIDRKECVPAIPSSKLVPKVPKKAAPHNLSQCIEKNISLGGSHSKKMTG